MLSMLCPLCSVPLIVVERRGIEIDYCLQCRGMWFDSGEIQLLAETLSLPQPDVRSTASSDASEAPRRCPRCATGMDKVHLGQTRAVIDSCSLGHGIWFDRGELGSIFEQESALSTIAQSAVVNFLGEVLGK